jgi:hypothetical protein
VVRVPRVPKPARPRRWPRLGLPPDRSLPTLPWDDRLGEIELSMRRTDQGAELEVRTPSGDADGSTHTLGWSWESRIIDVPFGTGLCPHAAWWEVELKPMQGATSKARFASPDRAK